MTNYTYKKISQVAETCYNNTKKEYRNGIDSKWSYYISKAILTPKKDVARIGVNDAPNPYKNGYISRTIQKNDYIKLIKDFVKFVETKKRLPNFVQIGKTKVRLKLWTAFVSYILYKYNKHGKLPSYQNINSKIYIKPTETDNEVYNYFVKKTNKKPKTIDEVLGYMQGKGYGGYYDDKLSNKQVIDGLIDTDDDLDANCVDSLQMLINMGKAMGYDTKCIHVQCRSSGTGHVFGKFRHKTYTGNTWITRDPASVLTGNSIQSVWCGDGYLLAENPDWFNENLNR